MGEQIRLGKFLSELEEASTTQLREWCRLMAQQVFVMHPAAIRYLAREAARNLSAAAWTGSDYGPLVFEPPPEGAGAVSE